MNRNWQIPRRSFLRGLGTMVALPMLNAMLPGLQTVASAAGKTASGFPRRLAFIYAPNGKNMAEWTPQAIGRDFDLPSILKPLEAHRHDFSVVSGLALDGGNAHGDGGGDHARGSASFLTGCHPRKTAGANIKAGISVDQIAAQHVGHETRLPSLELSCDNGQREGACESGYSCAYQFNISWRSESMPVNPEVDPRAVFERLFGGVSPAESAEAQARRKLYKNSVLDYVLDDARRLERRLAANDRGKLDQYLTAVREIEQRIERSERFPLPEVPAGVIAPTGVGAHGFEQHVRLMFDMLALALQTDSTRVATMIMAHEGSNRPYPQLGIGDGHHDISHHRNDADKKAKLALINRYHTTQFAYFLDRLKSVPEGDGTLLDNCMIVYGSSISDPNEHLHENLPVIVAGRGGGTLDPGRHVRVGDGTPMTNLYLSLLDRMGAPAEKIGDSTGKLEVIG